MQERALQYREQYVDRWQSIDIVQVLEWMISLRQRKEKHPILRA